MVVTGAHDGTRVHVYNISGLVETLPDINTPREDHACGQFLNSDSVIVSIQVHETKVDSVYLISNMLHIFPHIPSPRPWPPPLPRPCGPEWLDWLSRMSCDTVVIGHYNRINLFIFLIILNHSVNSTDCVVL